MEFLENLVQCTRNNRKSKDLYLPQIIPKIIKTYIYLKKPQNKKPKQFDADC